MPSSNRRSCRRSPRSSRRVVALRLHLLVDAAAGSAAAARAGAARAVLGSTDADALAAAAEAPRCPDAFSVIAPPAVMLRAVVAVTVWFAIVSARPTPTAAVEPPATTAPAVEEALAFCVAVR